MTNSNIVDMANTPEGRPNTNGGSSSGGGGSRGLPERVAALEAHMSHVATKSWVLGGVVGGMISAAIVALAVARIFQ